jgi:DNA-binding CsgD family transcriptional regulator
MTFLPQVVALYRKVGQRMIPKRPWIVIDTIHIKGLLFYMLFNELIFQFAGADSDASIVNHLLKEHCRVNGYENACHLTTNILANGKDKNYAHILSSPTETRRLDSDQFISIDADEIQKLESGQLYLEPEAKNNYSLHLRPNTYNSVFLLAVGIYEETTMFIVTAKNDPETMLRFKKSHYRELQKLSEILHFSALAEMCKPARYVEHTLTAREIEVLRWSAKGMSYKEIAALLSISARTVRFFLENIKQKLKCKNTTHAVSFALQNGII